MKSETKDNIIIICFSVLVIFNIFAVGSNLSSCLCTIGDTECIESCEQTGITNHITCFAVNVISLVVLGIIMWVWSKEK